MEALFDLVRIFPNRPLTKARSDPVFMAAHARAYVRAGLPVEILAPRWRVMDEAKVPFEEAADYFNLPPEVTIRHLGPSLSEALPDRLLRLSLAVPPLVAGRRTAGAVLYHHKDPLALSVAQLHRGVHVLEMTEMPTNPVARAAMRIVDGCVAIAPHLAAALEDRYPRLRGRVLGVRGGFDPDLAPWGAVDAAQARRQYDIAADERVVCYSGKISRTSTELPWILQAGAGLDLTFLVVGVTDATEGWLKSLVPPGCRLIPVRHVPPERLAEIYAAADLMVSYYESSHTTLAWIDPGKFPMYLASGRPTVAADHPSYADLLQDGVNAALAAPDDPAALAATYRRVLEDRELADRLQRLGRRTAETITIDRRVQQVLEFAASLRS